MKCIYCNNEANSHDHIPPKNIFSKPLPNDLITVPCCDICNASFSLDDEYFMATLTLIENTTPNSNKTALFEKLKRLKRRSNSAKFFAFLKSSTGFRGKITQSGVILPNQPGILINEDRIKTVLNRIIKGLVFKKIGRFCSIVIIILDNEPSLMPPNKQATIFELISLITDSPTINIGDGKVFSYKYAYPKTNPDYSVWLLTFFQSFYVLGLGQHEK